MDDFFEKMKDDNAKNEKEYENEDENHTYLFK